MTIDKVGRTDCSGCSLCSLNCPHKCITMQSDEEGFIQPVIDKSTCTDCGACYHVCPCKEPYDTENEPVYYASAIANKSLLKKSSSGGLFIAMATYIIEQRGYVCGCVFNEHMVAEHICTNSIDVVKQMMGSKYVQSNITSCLVEIKQLIKDNKKVLFTGTACQVAAVKHFTKNPTNLFCVDILCHGVPSPLYFKKYVDYLQNKHHGRLTKIEFRNKDKRGWGAEHRTYYEIEKANSTRGYRPFLPAYFSAFFWGINLRESCYNCKFTGTNRVSDITIGDFWGSWYYFMKEFKDGISIASVNTDKGHALLAGIKEYLDYCIEIPQKDALGSNTNFYHPTQKPSTRDSFYQDIKNKRYEQLRMRVFLDKTSRRKLLVSLYGLLIPEYIKKLKRKLVR